jgi:tetratricopeptide (TPR) repeat protein
MLGVTLAGAGRLTDAMAAYRTRQRLWQELSAGDPVDDAFFRVQAYIRAGDFATADQLLAERARDGSPLVRSQAFWWQVISLRNQARFGEALEAAKRYREVVGEHDVLAQMPAAQVLLEMGRVREAAARFEALAAAVRPPQAPRGSPDSALGLMSRTRAWHLTHEATAYAALGDTARLARLADSVEALGASGAYGRDRRLHHHLRGLLMLARGRRADAVAELERAIYSPTMGYTRTNLELGRTLIALGRPSEAAAALAPALRGDLQSSNYYVTHAELHEGLAQAYEAAGQADSARVHYAWVANAWAASDPRFQARAARARTKAHARARH